MLYQAIEAHLASLTPARLTARWMHQMMSHPMLPHSYTTGFRAAAAWLELFDRATQRPDSTFRSVDFPAPFGPRITVWHRCGIISDRSRNTLVSPR